MRVGPEHKRVRAGGSVTFTCLAADDSLHYGTPHIEWRLDDTIINYRKHQRFTKSAVDNSLTIRNVSIVDTGLITCVASHEDSYDSKSAQFVVEGEKKIT